MGLRHEEQPGDPPHRAMLVLKRPEPESWRESAARVELKGLRGSSRAGESRWMDGVSGEDANEGVGRLQG